MWLCSRQVLRLASNAIEDEVTLKLQAMQLVLRSSRLIQVDLTGNPVTSTAIDNMCEANGRARDSPVHAICEKIAICIKTPYDETAFHPSYQEMLDAR